MFFEWLENYSNQNIINNPFQNSKNPSKEFLDKIDKQLDEIDKK